MGEARQQAKARVYMRIYTVTSFTERERETGTCAYTPVTPLREREREREREEHAHIHTHRETFTRAYTRAGIDSDLGIPSRDADSLRGLL